MADESSTPGTLQAFPNCVAPIAAAAFAAGQPGYIVAASGEANLAKADAAATANVVGIAVQPAAAGDNVYLRYSGPVNLTVDQWDAVVSGAEGGLTLDTYYYLSSTSVGKLTDTAPVAGGTFKTAIGLAISTTILVVGQHVPVAN